MNIQKLYSLIRQAIEKYNLIDEGDKIAIGISGGKDSLTLLMAMAGIQRFYPKKFELMAITCDLGYGGMDFSEVKKLCETLNVPYEIIPTQINEIIAHHPEESPCSLCARLRKGTIYERLDELGYKKIAYAHHKDDFLETALMSLLYEGRFYCFPPKTYLDKTGITVIRPMMYVPEKSVISFAEREGLPVVHNTCPVDGASKRQYFKELVARLDLENPGAKKRIMHAIESGNIDGWNID